MRRIIFAVIEDYKHLARVRILDIYRAFAAHLHCNLLLLLLVLLLHLLYLLCVGSLLLTMASLVFRFENGC